MTTTQQAVSVMFNRATDFLLHPWYAQLLLAIFAGAFICVGAALSVVLSGGVEWSGPATLLTGMGFLAGFSMVIFSGSALFTEINVCLPLTLYMRFHAQCSSGRPCFSAHVLKIVRFWLVCYVGNVCGALLMSSMLAYAGILAEGDAKWLRLDRIVVDKLKFDSLYGWTQVFVSACVGNWLVGMAAFLAAHADTLPGKLVGCTFPVLSFVSLGVQHSPANMGYFALGLMRSGTPWAFAADSFWWNLLPASLGNTTGAALFVALGYYVIYAAPGISARDNAFLRRLNGEFEAVLLNESGLPLENRAGQADEEAERRQALRSNGEFTSCPSLDLRN